MTVVCKKSYPAKSIMRTNFAFIFFCNFITPKSSGHESALSENNMASDSVFGSAKVQKAQKPMQRWREEEEEKTQPCSVFPLALL